MKIRISKYLTLNLRREKIDLKELNELTEQLLLIYKDNKPIINTKVSSTRTYKRTKRNSKQLREITKELKQLRKSYHKLNKRTPGTKLTALAYKHGYKTKESMCLSLYSYNKNKEENK